MNAAAVWFFDHGVGVFPLVARSKVPACTTWVGYAGNRAQVARFHSYGVRLGRCRGDCLVVVDTDTPDAEAWVATHLPSTPLVVATARGWHRYFRAVGPQPKYIHRDGHTIECRNQGQYVVGPGSIHASGAVYAPTDWSWKWEDISWIPSDLVFDDRSPEARGAGVSGPDGGRFESAQPYTIPPAIFAGERHDQMFRLMRSLQARGVDPEGARAACHVENRAKCCPLLDEDELDRYLCRIAGYGDQPGFIRTSQSAWDLFGGLCEIGLSIEAVLTACRSVNPDFDPDRAALEVLGSPDQDVPARLARIAGVPTAWIRGH